MYELRDLPYGVYALEPFIDTHTMGLHYHKHLQGYLDRLNDLLIKSNYDFRYPIYELPLHINEFDERVRGDILYNLGGVLNHYVYFDSMSSPKEMPRGNFQSSLLKRFGNYERFVNEFKEKAMSLKGSGYTFLVVDQEGQLEIVNMFNQDTPYNYGLVPLIALDMWEHAYYLNYQNNKELYIDNYFDIINFKMANDFYDANPA